MIEVGTFSRIDPVYVKEYITEWCKKHNTSCAGISRKILGRSDSFLSQAIRNGKMRNFELKLLCDASGLDVDRAVWIPPAESDEPSKKSENDGGEAAQNVIDYSARLESIEEQLMKINTTCISMGKVVADIMGTLYKMAEEPEKTRAAIRPVLSQILNKMKYGGLR